MKRILRVILSITLTIVSAGCSNSSESLSGTWNAAITTSQGYSFNESLVLNSDGTGSTTLTATGNCAGVQKVTGIVWSSSGNTITFAGTSRCTSTVMCTAAEGTVAAIDCATIAPYYLVGACNFTLSNANNTLALENCSRAPQAAATFTRVL